jgi:hypothetical protein
LLIQENTVSGLLEPFNFSFSSLCPHTYQHIVIFLSPDLFLCTEAHHGLALSLSCTSALLNSQFCHSGYNNSLRTRSVSQSHPLFAFAFHNSSTRTIFTVI